jgi:peptidyl-prolyl cis-trans isomerase SurA
MRWFLLPVLLCLSFSASALRDSSFSIVAIVNDAVISSRDLQQRVALNLSAMNAMSLDAARQRALEQATLQTLIDEQLKLQEADRYSIIISTEELDNAIRTLEQQQRLPEGTIAARLDASGVGVDVLREQLKGDLAWQRLLSRETRRNVSVSDEEVEQAQARISRGEKIEQAQIASIILPVADGQDVDAVGAWARELRRQLVSGASAEQVLDLFQDKVTLEYGPLSWVEVLLMDAGLRETIQGLEPGEIAEPVLTSAGWQVVRLMDKRFVSTLPAQNAEVALKEIVLKLSEQSLNLEIEAMMDIARNIAKYPGTCRETELAGLNTTDGLNIDVDYVRTELARMSPDLRNMVEPLSVTGITEPFAAEDGIHLLMLCEKMAIPLPQPDRDKVRAVLYQEKMQLEAEKYLRRLRREAFIDVRV